MMILQQTRGVLSSGDQCSLDLPFAVTKSLTARIGPTPVFTRASAATFIGSDGLIQTATTNTPRFDHDPSSLVCKGLLIEETRTNLVFPSETLTTQTRTVTATSTTLSFYGTGTVVLSGAASATVVGLGAYPTRTTLTFTPTAGSLTLTVTGSVQYAQLEAGAFVTSYIPTTTASGVRSPDVCSITGTNFTGFYSQSEGSLFASSIKPSTNSNSFVYHCSDGTFNNGIDLRYSTATQVSALLNVSNVNQLTGMATNVTASASTKQIFGYKLNNCAYSVNGGSPVIDLSVTTPTVSQLIIGNAGAAGNVYYLNGTILSIRYYRKRLSNTKLQALSA